jgi:CDP-glycerol glycerophosphotransferase (TagB/SpsB family)
MKNLFYSLFALFFNISRIFPVKENRVALLAPHRGGNHDSLSEIGSYLENKGGYEVNLISTSQLSSFGGALDFFINKSRLLATSKYVFMNDNFMPMASLNFSEKAIITMLWHAEGAFKKFGLITDLPPKIEGKIKACSSKLTYVICSSKNVAPVYAKAFGVSESKVIPLGSPRIDFLLKEHNIDKLRSEFDNKFPECKGKKLVLYAPTFRDNSERDKDLLNHINFSKFNSALGDEYALLIKLHPQVHSSVISENFTDVTALDIAKLTLICDMVITDYSSVCMDFALLSKPCIFYAYDLKDYENERSFCFGYKGYVPGPVVENFDDVIENIKNSQGTEKLQKFREFNFDYTDDKSTERVAEFIISQSK